MNGSTIRIGTDTEAFDAYLSLPTTGTGTGPGVLVIQEWWGLVPHIMNVTDRFAAAGFCALAPDLYGGKSASEPDEAGTLMQALSIADTERTLRKAILTLMSEPSTVPNDRVGVVGFCMGGQLAMFAASSNPVVQATVNFYGIHPKVQPSYRELNGPVLGHFAEFDEYASPAAVAALREELTLLQKPFEFHTYPGTKHAFFNDERPEVYDAEASETAWLRTIAFLRSQLIG